MLWRTVSSFVWLLLVWLAATGSLLPTAVGVGAAVALLAGVGLSRLQLEQAPLLLLPHRVFFMLLYLPFLLWQVICANLDVAWRVLHPALPIRPGIVRVRTTLRTEAGRVLLANSITLTPGTLSVDLRGDTLYIHRIAVPRDDPEGETTRYLARFERFIRRILE